MPKTTLGKWSVGLNTLLLATITVSCVLVLVLKILSFDDQWWDITVGIAFPLSIIALITGVIAVKKYKEQSISIKVSLFMGVLTILFILLHSLFISD